MKKFLYKYILYFTIFLLTCLFLVNILNYQLKQMSEIYLENGYLNDAMVICTKLNSINPNQNYKATCSKIEQKIVHNINKLDNMKFAFLYLDYMQNNNILD